MIRLRGQAGEVGDAVHRLVQRLQQPQAVGLERRVVGVDHDAVEESVHRRAQRSQRLQAGGVIARVELRVGAADRRVVALHGGRRQRVHRCREAEGEGASKQAAEKAAAIAKRAYAERLRRTVEQHNFDIADGNSIKMTCSIGFACFPDTQGEPAILSWNQVIDVADICLYAAKKSQRNAWIGVEKLAAHTGFQDLISDMSLSVAANQVKIVSSIAADEIVWD